MKYLGPLARKKNELAASAVQERKVSINNRSQKRKEEMTEYKKLRSAYLKKHPGCICFGKMQCGAKATDIHHIRGRIHGLLNDQQFWMPVCRKAHDWIGDNMEAARALGWLAGKGQWNLIPK